MFVRTVWNARLTRIALSLAALIACSQSPAWAQNGGGFGRFSAVGGIAINADGVVRNMSVDEAGKLRQLRHESLQPVGGDIKQWSDLRMVSLRGLEAALAESKDDPTKRSDEINCLAGLQRVRYVFVNPENNDIILAGPAEGWKLDKQNNIVGQTTGRPVVMLDDLLVALRSSTAAAQGGLTCSIDPTDDGIQRLQQFVRTQTQFTPEVVSNIERELGMQTITIQGVPLTSRFASVMLAADYRMKRLAMAFDKSPIPGLPSYMNMVSGGNAGVQNIMPRWWLATNYESLLRDPEGLAWEIRGQGVQCMTEDEVIADGGARNQTGKTSPAAKRWADTMTAKYDELAGKDPIFGDLRNIMDLAVVAALISRENLTAKAAVELPLLTGDESSILSAEYAVPKQVPSISKALKKGRHWIISASGGVEIASWQVAEKQEEDASLADVRQKVATTESANWWWD
ncbi:MAG: DUF1598 domain-containing protein [Pirellulales bacterium]